MLKFDLDLGVKKGALICLKLNKTVVMLEHILFDNSRICLSVFTFDLIKTKYMIINYTQPSVDSFGGYGG